MVTAAVVVVGTLAAAEMIVVVAASVVYVTVAGAAGEMAVWVTATMSMVVSFGVMMLLVMEPDTPMVAGDQILMEGYEALKEFKDKSQPQANEPAEKSIPPVIDESCLEHWEEIGHGGFGTVFKAHHKEQQRDVALKFLKGVGTKDVLYSEVKKMLTASISSHIIDIHGICLEPHFGIVMTYMENGSLKDLLGQHDIPLALRWRFAREISLGLDFLHSLKPQIIHCDVKAANVLLDKDYHVKIADFGLAKWRTASRVVNSVSPESATPTHAPPEYFQGREPDAKSDVYSFGITVWEIQTRRKPYEYMQPKHLPDFVRGGNRPREDLLPDDADGDMVTLMKACWAEDPLDRPPMKDVCSCLTECGAKYSDLDMSAAISSVKKKKEENKAAVMGPEHLSGRQLSFDLK